MFQNAEKILTHLFLAKKYHKINVYSWKKHHIIRVLRSLKNAALPMTGQELRQLIEKNGFGTCWPDVETWLRREILLSPVESKFDDLPIGNTKQGGEPDLPPRLAWPKYKCRNIGGQRNTSRPMTFLMQLRCGDIKPFAPAQFPDHGLLSFFVGIEHNALVRDGNDRPVGCVVYATEPFARTPFPRGLYFGNRLAPHTLKIEPSQSIGFEPLNEAVERQFGYSPETSERVWDFYRREIIPGGCHKMFGSPSMLELDIVEECRLAAKQNDDGVPENTNWQLLLEYDLADLPVDESGRLYVMIRNDDLVACDFGGVYVMHDCPE